MSDSSEIADHISAVVQAVETAILGKRGSVELALAVLLSGGHLLIEDIPGVGKTTLAKALSRALGCEFKRIQFTPDLLPSDVTGSAVYNQKTGDFDFRRGPVFANVVLADEINRATPKTQSSLLECMEERQVTSDGITRPLPAPFFVIATQNNVEMRGTYPLPEAQLDRFSARVSIGYPSSPDEMRILRNESRSHAIDRIQSVISAADLLDLQKSVREVFVEDTVAQYLLQIVGATRTMPDVALGCSPRASLHLMLVCQAMAIIRNRSFVIPEDIKTLAVPVLAHRIMLKPEYRMRGITAEQCIFNALQDTPVPVEARRAAAV